jgi:hypothetical protein
MPRIRNIKKSKNATDIGSKLPTLRDNNSDEKKESEKGISKSFIKKSTKSTSSTTLEKGESCNSEKGLPSNNNRNRIYAFTINNYTDDIIRDIYSFFKKSTKSTNKNTLLGGLFVREVGELGTPHLQGALKFSQPILFTSIRKLCPAFEKAHMEMARKEWIANVQYCLKTIKYGNIENILYCDEYNETIMKCLCVIFEDHKNYIINLYSECAKYFDMINKTKSKKIKAVDIDKEIILANRAEQGIRKPLDRGIIRYGSLSVWQKHFVDIFLDTPDRRTIYWIYDKFGGAGKSTLARYLQQTNDDVITVCGKSADVKYLVKQKFDTTDGEGIRLVIYDVPRTSVGYISYTALEEIKGGNINSTKYECGNIMIPYPHLFVFANSLPDMNAVSNSRWKIYNVSMDIYCGDYDPADPFENGEFFPYNDTQFFNFKNDTYTKSTKKTLDEFLENNNNKKTETDKNNTTDDVEIDISTDTEEIEPEEKIEKKEEPKNKQKNKDFFDIVLNPEDFKTPIRFTGQFDGTRGSSFRVINNGPRKIEYPE